MRVLPELGLDGKKNEEIAKLDIKDKKILWMLSQNVRTPLNAIAKKVELSRDSVSYRIKMMEQKNVIKNSRALVDVAKLGYESYHLFLKLNSPTKEAEQTIIKSLSNLPYVRAILKLYGTFDFEIAVIAKTIVEFDEILAEIINKTKDYLRDYEILIITKSLRAGAFPNKFLKGIETKTLYKKENLKKDKKEYFPDKKDLEIIKVIRDNAQLTLLDISNKVKISPDSVSYRIKNLTKNVIISFVPVINYHAAGYNTYVLMANIAGLDKEKEMKIEQFMKTNPNILWAVKTVGRYNVLFYVCTEKENELQETINELRNTFPEQVKYYESLLAFAQYKYTYAPDCIFE